MNIYHSLDDPKYGDHPVSGNRDFGYVRNSNGSYTFYTRGVDRLTSWEGASLQIATNFPFSSADNLWKSFQSKITAHVNSNGGKAVIANPQIERPDWSLVKDIIGGRTSLSALNKACN